MIASHPKNGRYAQVAPISKGGMGTVYLAVQRSGDFKKLHAIKRPHEHLMADRNFVAMLLDEARISGLIQHPNVVGVSEFGIDEEGPFLVMDYVESVTAAALILNFLEDEECAPLQLALRIAIDIASGLHAAHELTDDNRRPLGLVHRDVSPQNILVDFSGRAYLTDFGVAKALGARNVSRAGFAKGKVAYMAPEQIRNQLVDRRTDLYALGVVLYELLAGDRLYPGLKEAAIVDRLLDGSPPDIGEYREDISPALTSLLFDLMARDISKRPDNAAMVCSALESILAEDLVKNGNQSWGTYLERRFGERRQKRTQAFENALTKWTQTQEAKVTSEESTDSQMSRRPSMFGPRTKRISFSTMRWIAAGCLAVLLGVALSFILRKRRPRVPPTTAAPRNFKGFTTNSKSSNDRAKQNQPVAVSHFGAPTSTRTDEAKVSLTGGPSGRAGKKTKRRRKPRTKQGKRRRAPNPSPENRSHENVTSDPPKRQLWGW